MWWPDMRLHWTLRPAGVLLIAVWLGGCFQPLYGERSLAGGPGLRQTLAAVDVQQIEAPRGSPEARVAVEIRNALLFELTGGGGSISPTHRLAIRMRTSRQAVIVDADTGRYEAIISGINADYALTELATGKVVVTGTTGSRVSSDIPGQQQRFAQARALREAEDRAARVIAEQIRTRLASFFVAGA